MPSIPTVTVYSPKGRRVNVNATDLPGWLEKGYSESKPSPAGEKDGPKKGAKK